MDLNPQPIKFKASLISVKKEYRLELVDKYNLNYLGNGDWWAS